MENEQEQMARSHGEHPHTRPLYVYVFSVLFLLAVTAGTILVVKANRRPGQMTLIESQAMDMTVMKAPVGSVPVALETAEHSSFGGEVTYSGSVTPFAEQEVFPRVEGWIAEMNAYPGDVVTKGQLLARLESPDVDQRAAAAIADANASQAAADAAGPEVGMADAMSSAAGSGAERMKSMVDAAQAQADAAQAELTYRNGELARMEKLYESGAISKSELDQERSMAAAARADFAKMNDEVRAAQFDFNRMTSEKKSAGLNIEAMKRQRSSMQAMAKAGRARAGVETATRNYLEIRSLLDGVVTERLVSPGTLARPGVPIMRISDIKRVRIQANVSETDAAGVAPGNRVEITSPRRPGEKFYSTITSVFPASDPTTRTVVVEADVNNSDRRFLPGDYVTMRISTGKDLTVITVPDRAIIRWGNGGKPYVWMAAAEGPKGKIQYTCTMHPEVIRDKPGDCPKCGMPLVPKASSGALRARKVEVVVGRSGGGRVEIVSGLEHGDRVVVDGGSELAEGDALFETSWSADGPKELPPATSMEGMPGMGGGDKKGGDMKDMPGMDKKESGNTGGDMKNMQGMDTKGGNSGMDDMKGMDMSGGKKVNHNTHGMDMNNRKPGKSKQGMSGMKMDAAAGKVANKGQAGVVYTCEMHPEVKSDKPGDCPKCGMKLTPEKK